MFSTYLMMLFATTTQDFNLPPGLLSALCWVESNHQARAVNPDDGGSPSVGVCQIKPSTARILGFKGSRQALMQPKYNIKYAAKYLKQQIDRYNGDLRQGVAAYNAGKCRFNSKHQIMNRQYVDKVFKAWAKGR